MPPAALTIGLQDVDLTEPLSEPSDGFGQVQVTGAATLAGTLKWSLLGGFMPMAGDFFQIVSAGGGLSGSLALEILPALSGGLDWDVQYNPNSVVLAVIGSSLLGDYNQDGIVDAADYVVWRNTLGQMGAGPGRRRQRKWSKIDARRLRCVARRLRSDCRRRCGIRRQLAVADAVADPRGALFGYSFAASWSDAGQEFELPNPPRHSNLGRLAILGSLRVQATRLCRIRTSAQIFWRLLMTIRGNSLGSLIMDTCLSSRRAACFFGLILSILVAPLAQAINITVQYDATQPNAVMPAFDPNGTQLMAIANYVANFYEDVFEDNGHSLSLTFWYTDLNGLLGDHDNVSDDGTSANRWATSKSTRRTRRAWRTISSSTPRPLTTANSR